MPIDIETLPQSNVAVVIESAAPDQFDLRKQQSAPPTTFRSGSGVVVTDSACR